MSQRPFEVDPTDIAILIEALEGIVDRSLDVNRILLGAQIARRNNERAAGPVVAGLLPKRPTNLSVDDQVAAFAAELEAIPTFEPPTIPPPEGFQSP